MFFSIEQRIYLIFIPVEDEEIVGWLNDFAESKARPEFEKMESSVA